MRRWLDLAGSRRVPPVILGVFLTLYIGIAFVDDEALVGLMTLTAGNVALLGLLLLLPLNLAAQLAVEVLRAVEARRVAAVTPEVLRTRFDETVITGSAHRSAAVDWLRAGGYRLRQDGDALRASRGIGLWPVRLVWLAALGLLFLGIFLSLTMRQVTREVVIEGEPLPNLLQSTAKVAAIRLEEVQGLSFLARDLTIHLTEAGDGRERRLGLYPPGKVGGRLLYPRYLGVAPRLVLSGVGLPRLADYYLLALYPPGKEDQVELPGSGVTLAFRLLAPPGEDPYVTGAFSFAFRATRGDEVLAAGVIPAGGSFAGDNLRLAIPDVRRIVYADFVADPGIPLLWAALLLLPASLLAGLLIRGLHPRREILLVSHEGRIVACSRAEGRRLQHGGVFNEMVDILERQTGQVVAGQAVIP